MHDIKNLTNSPYDIHVVGGKRDRLPARGKLESVEIDPLYLPLYRTLGYFEITEARLQINVTVASDQGDALSSHVTAIAKAEAENAIANYENRLPSNDLAAQYEELTGKKPDGRWSDARLQAEIDKALEA